MADYSVTRSSTALSTTNDLITIVSAANRRAKIKAISVGGMATTSAANSVQVSRSTGGTTPGGALTAQLKSNDNPAAATLIYTTWAAQPTLAAGGPLLRLPVNANGGAFRWVAPPGQEIEIRNGEQISVRSETGTSNVVITVEFEE